MLFKKEALEVDLTLGRIDIMAQRNGYVVRKRDEEYGFINPLDGSKDVFFNASSLDNIAFSELAEGDCVNFDVKAGPKGPFATFVGRDFIVTDDPDAAQLSDETIEISSHNLQQYAELVKKLDRKLIQYFIENPNAIHAMDPKIASDYFEQIYVEFLKQDGYAVERIGGLYSPDGCADLIGVRMIGEIQIRTVVQCKHTKNRVSAEPVRSLNGVLDRFSANAGIVATTNYFTKPATEEARQYYFKITLHNFDVYQKQLMRLGRD